MREEEPFSLIFFWFFFSAFFYERGEGYEADKVGDAEGAPLLLVEVEEGKGAVVGATGYG